MIKNWLGKGRIPGFRVLQEMRKKKKERSKIKEGENKAAFIEGTKGCY